MAFTVAGNLAKIETAVKHCYPGIVVGTIGDQTHAAESGGSDHNPDSRGIVHAIDLMFENDTNFHAGAPATLAWLLTPGVRGSLEYVIHDRKIYSRNSGNPWIAEVYHGTDPHTNHIHVSGKHGATGKNKATGTGYDVAAEHATPAGSPCATSHPTIPVVSPEDDVPLNKADLDLIFNDARFSDLAWRTSAVANLSPTFGGGTQKNKPVPFTTAIKAMLNPTAIAAAVVAALPPSSAGGLTQAEVEQAVTDALAKIQITVDAD